MIRLFEQHVSRKQKELDGLWNFKTAEGKAYQLPVPGCWEQNQELLTYRGKGTYTKDITVHEETNIRLEFKGVSHTATVLLDGVEVAHHYNAYTIFEVVLTK